jgi:streptogrisin D
VPTPFVHRRLAVPLTAGTLISAALTVSLPATALNTDPDDVPPATVSADRLAAQLGPTRTAGVYVDQDTGRMVVTVTDAAAERAVTEAGSRADRVAHSTRDLRAISTHLDATIDVGGTAWGTDIDDNRVDVTADSTVTDAEYAELRRVLAPYGDAARLTRVDGRYKLDGPVNGGKFIRSDDGFNCSAGFNVRKRSNHSSKLLLTAGHCTTVLAPGVSDWKNGAGTYFGYDAGGRFPVADYGIIRHNAAAVANPGNIYLHGTGNVRDVTRARNPYQGEAVCVSGYRSGVTCGTVIALDVTVDYENYGKVYGLFQSNACTQGGDSGGSVFSPNDPMDDTAAIGLHSGSRSSGCTAHHQPVKPALDWYNVEVY